MKDLSLIIQTESENKIIKLNESFIILNKYKINQLIAINGVNDILEYNEGDYYELLSSFCLEELKWLYNVNYKANIFEQIFVNDKIIKKHWFIKNFVLLFFCSLK